MDLSNGGDQLTHQRTMTRPPIHSHHSSSVPSTPYQQPRDLRFHSRSPSPGRALGNQSPRSVVSEAVGPSLKRSAPVVCKFETGAEIRKRRIPYVEGGNEELGPPKKEPKRALEPDEHDKLSGDMRELYDRLLPSQESEERRTLLVTKLEKILNEEWPGHDIRVHVFGSSGNELSSSDSDVDICITTTLKKLESMHSIATLLDKNGMQNVVCRASAKVPIVKCWDPELRLAADLNVNNTLALENTRMIKTYVQLDDRVRPLTKIIKYWTKRRILNDAALNGTISSYTWICMIISFLQRRKPPILPSLQKKVGEEQNDADSREHKFDDDVEKLRAEGNDNKETQAELLFQFFRHYGYEFEYSKYVVSIREGKPLSRKEKGWDPSNWQDKEARNRLCVEEPFTTNRNLGNSADDYAWSGIHAEIRRAFDLLADGGQLEKCCEQYEFPPEEKPIFQRAPPKPKPTLTRSASQSGRPNHEQGSGRAGRKGGNRNQSSQRSGNRRASSGATFSNQRIPLGFQSPLSTVAMNDYFAKGDLHNQLYQQYQFLQAQQEALQRQLQQSAQEAQARSQGRSSEASGSPLTRAYSNGLPSPRFPDNGPQTAPLLPGYLYHYPARYPPPSPMSQARSREGSSTNPSSPSMSAAQPLLRRQVHRGSLPDEIAGSNRSRSQPGRSLPHPLTLQQHAHPGYDVSGALGAQYQEGRRPSQVYAQSSLGLQMPFPLMGGGYPATAPADSAMPKEYIGYYVGQSPSLGPQYPHPGQVHMPPMNLRESPQQRPRRVTPELLPPLPNGRQTSRSPSPLGTQRSYSIDDLPPVAHPQIQQSLYAYEMAAVPAPPPPSRETDPEAPLIVNGSVPVSVQKSPERVNGISSPRLAAPAENFVPVQDRNEVAEMQSPPTRSLDAAFAPEPVKHSEETPTSPQRTSAVSKLKTAPTLSLAANGTRQNGEQTPEHHHHDQVPAPLLSPVAELRTPSPTYSLKESPQANGLIRAAKIANAKQAERGGENTPPISPKSKRVDNASILAVSPPSKHERTGSAPNPTTATSKPASAAQSAAVAAVAPPKTPTSPPPPSANTVVPVWSNGPAASANVNHNSNPNPWVQVQSVKKGHRKSKSSGAANAGKGGPVVPLNDMDRKGG